MSQTSPSINPFEDSPILSQRSLTLLHDEGYLTNGSRSSSKNTSPSRRLSFHSPSLPHQKELLELKHECRKGQIELSQLRLELERNKIINQSLQDQLTFTVKDSQKRIDEVEKGRHFLLSAEKECQEQLVRLRENYDKNITALEQKVKKLTEENRKVQEKNDSLLEVKDKIESKKRSKREFQLSPSHDEAEENPHSHPPGSLQMLLKEIRQVESELNKAREEANFYRGALEEKEELVKEFQERASVFEAKGLMIEQFDDALGKLREHEQQLNFLKHENNKLKQQQSNSLLQEEKIRSLEGQTKGLKIDNERLRDVESNYENMTREFQMSKDELIRMKHQTGLSSWHDLLQEYLSLQMSFMKATETMGQINAELLTKSLLLNEAVNNVKVAEDGQEIHRRCASELLIEKEKLERRCSLYKTDSRLAKEALIEWMTKYTMGTGSTASASEEIDDWKRWTGLVEEKIREWQQSVPNDKERNEEESARHDDANDVFESPDRQYITISE